MSKEKKCCKWKKPLIIICVLAVLAFVGWLVYYLFFKDDPEELDETLFSEKKEEITEEETAEAEEAAPAEEEAEEAEEAAPEEAPEE